MCYDSDNFSFMTGMPFIIYVSCNKTSLRNMEFQWSLNQTIVFVYSMLYARNVSGVRANSTQGLKVSCFQENCYLIHINDSTRDNLSSGVCEQHMHSHSLVSAFINRVLESIVSKIATSEISVFQLVSEAEETGFSLALSETPKTGFLATRPNYSFGPLSVRKRNAIGMTFRWWADNGPLLYAYWFDFRRVVFVLLKIRCGYEIFCSCALQYGHVHNSLVLIAYAQRPILNVHVDASTAERNQLVGLSPPPRRNEINKFTRSDAVQWSAINSTCPTQELI